MASPRKQDSGKHHEQTLHDAAMTPVFDELADSPLEEPEGAAAAEKAPSSEHQRRRLSSVPSVEGTARITAVTGQVRKRPAGQAKDRPAEHAGKRSEERGDRAVGRLSHIVLAALAASMLILGTCLASGKAGGSFNDPSLRTNYTETQMASFYHADVPGNRTKPADLPRHPNVIIIFTEGLSQELIDDECDLMPNVRAYQNRSLNFTDYYNHTFATWRGLNGQIYSGYQGANFDENRLISIGSLMSDAGYTTVFINTEPFTSEFTGFVEAMGFDRVINPDVPKLDDNWVNDGQAYEVIFETAEELDAEDEPFLICIYTYNTHAFRDAFGEEYGDGSSAFLNKFYNCDYHFGLFMERYENSDLADDTIIVFTTDHCTYQEPEYTDCFPALSEERESGMVDEIPFFIYYPGIVPETIDAAGRNSLDMVPTVLDYVDVSGSNYFLGRSLFFPAEVSTFIEHAFVEQTAFYMTEPGLIRQPTPEERAEAFDQTSRYLNICNPDIAPGASTRGWRPDQLHDRAA